MGLPGKLRAVHPQPSFCRASRIFVHEKAALGDSVSNTTSHGASSEFTRIGVRSVCAAPLSHCHTSEDVPVVLWDALPEAGNDKPFLDVSTGLTTGLFGAWKLLGGACCAFTHTAFPLVGGCL